MSKRVASMTPAAIGARERRADARRDRDYREFQAEVMRLVKENGMDFDDAWVAAGGDHPIPIDFFYEHTVH
jgi:hypothetical protein